MQSSHTLDVRQSIPGHWGSLGNAGQASSARPSRATGQLSSVPLPELKGLQALLSVLLFSMVLVIPGDKEVKNII